MCCKSLVGVWGIHLRQVDYDRERDKAIAAHNLLVMRVTNDAIDQQLDQAIQFDHQPSRVAIEVGQKPIDHLLPPKVQPL